MSKQIIFLLALIIFSLAASAQEMYYQNSLQWSPLGVITKSYTLNFEHRFDAKNGVFAEGSIANSDQVDGYNFTLHYRRYKEPKLGAKYLFFTSKVGVGFLGFFIRNTDYSGMMEMQEDDEKVKYYFDYSGYYIGANFGKTCLWDSGFSLGYRFGYGFPIMADIKWKNEGPLGKEFAESFYIIFSGLDFNMTIGYSF